MSRASISSIRMMSFTIESHKDNDIYEKFKVLWLIWIDFSTLDSLKNVLAPPGQHGNTSIPSHRLASPRFAQFLSDFLISCSMSELSPLSSFFFLFLCLLTPNLNVLFPNSQHAVLRDVRVFSLLILQDTYIMVLHFNGMFRHALDTWIALYNFL